MIHDIKINYDMFIDELYHDNIEKWKITALNVKLFLNSCRHHMRSILEKMAKLIATICAEVVTLKSKGHTTQLLRAKKIYKVRLINTIVKTGQNIMLGAKYIVQLKGVHWLNQISAVYVEIKKSLMAITMIIKNLSMLFGCVDNATQILIRKRDIINIKEAMPHRRLISEKELI